MTWDTTKPASDRLRSLGDDDIRELKTDIETALTAYGRFPIVAGTPEYHYYGQRGATGSRPTNGEGGLYYDTTLNQLLRDNGVSWDQLTEKIPSGTKMYFYNTTAPGGWTTDVTINDRLLLVNSASAGTTLGSSWAITTAAGGSHRHNIGLSHTPAAFHQAWRLYKGTYGGAVYADVDSGDQYNGGGLNSTGGTARPSHRYGQLSDGGTMDSYLSTHTHAMDHGSTTYHKVARGIVAEKT